MCFFFFLSLVCYLSHQFRHSYQVGNVVEARASLSLHFFFWKQFSSFGRDPLFSYFGYSQNLGLDRLDEWTKQNFYSTFLFSMSLLFCIQFETNYRLCNGLFFWISWSHNFQIEIPSENRIHFEGDGPQKHKTGYTISDSIQFQCEKEFLFILKSSHDQNRY